MNAEVTKEWSEAILHAISHAHLAHAESGRTPDDAVRFHDHMTPYLAHPLWCAASLLQEPELDMALRRRGSIALLWHDTLEDTSLPLPPNTADDIAELVRNMSFKSFDEEKEELWDRPVEVKATLNKSPS